MFLADGGSLQLPKRVAQIESLAGGSSVNCTSLSFFRYRDRLKGVQILLNTSQAGPGRKVKQEQEEISRNHVQAF